MRPTRYNQGDFAGARSYRLQVIAERLDLVGGFEELVCLDALDFDPFLYQVNAARAALRRFRGRGMSCDEVGLGKTIEAGLVIKEYLMRQIIERVLILTAPGWVQQCGHIWNTLLRRFLARSAILGPNG